MPSSYPVFLRRFLSAAFFLFILFLLAAAFVWLRRAASVDEYPPFISDAKPAEVSSMPAGAVEAPMMSNEVLSGIQTIDLGAPPVLVEQPAKNPDLPKKILKRTVQKQQPPKSEKKLRIPNDPAIIYPVESRRAGEQGRVLLDLTLAASGRVMAVKVSRSSGYPRLDEAAVQGASLWIFDPPSREGEHLFLPVTFRLNNPQAGS